MARVTEEEVQEIIDTDISLSPFITAASNMVDNRLSGKMDDDTLKEIERWLAAHFASVMDQRAQSEKRGDASMTYQGQTGMNLDATLYGQQAQALDTTGSLANAGAKKAVFRVAGG